MTYALWMIDGIMATCRLGMACHPSTFLGCQLPGFAVHRAAQAMQLFATCYNTFELLETLECHGLPKNRVLSCICPCQFVRPIAWAENSGAISPNFAKLPAWRWLGRISSNGARLLLESENKLNLFDLLMPSASRLRLH